MELLRDGRAGRQVREELPTPRGLYMVSCGARIGGGYRLLPRTSWLVSQDRREFQARRRAGLSWLESRRQVDGRVVGVWGARQGRFPRPIKESGRENPSENQVTERRALLAPNFRTRTLLSLYAQASQPQIRYAEANRWGTDPSNRAWARAALPPRIAV